MDAESFMKIVESMVAQGPLVAYLFYQNTKSEKKTKDQEEAIATLNAALREKQEIYLTKTFETISSNTAAINGLKDVITVKNG